MPNTSATKPYSILLIASFYSSAQTEMECALLSRGRFESAEQGDKYCESLLDYYFPRVKDGEEAHFNRRHSFIEVSEAQYENLEKIETGGTGLIFVYSVE